MIVLENFPMINQNASPTLDGRPDENHYYNCVESSICAIILYYHPELRGKVTPDSLKDQRLGEGWVNRGSDAAWFVQLCLKYGIKLYSVTASSTQEQVALGHKLLQSLKPVIFTEIDPYIDQRRFPGTTHASVWFKEVPGGLGALDVFTGRVIEKSDAAWANDLRGNVLWTADKQPVQQSSFIVPENWHDDGTTLTAPNGHKVVRGFRLEIGKGNWDKNNMPLGEEYATPNGSQQDFAYCSLTWNAKDGVKHLDGQGFIDLLQGRLTTLNALASHDKAMISDLQAQLQQAQNQASLLKGVQDERAGLQVQVAQLQMTIKNDEETINKLQVQLEATKDALQLMQALKPFVPAIQNA